VFTVEVLVDEEVVGRGTGKTRRTAETVAAGQALDTLSRLAGVDAQPGGEAGS